MSKSIFCIIAVISLAICTMDKSFAQNNDYYWYKNQKVFLEKIPNKKYLVLEDIIKDTNELKQKLNLPDTKVDKFDKTNVFSGINAHKGNVKSEKKWAVIEKENIANVTLNTKNEIIYEAPFYKTTEQKEIGLSHLFYVKLLSGGDLGKLETLALNNNVEILGNNKFMPLWFTLSCSKNSNGNALEMANMFHESGLFSSSEPNFIIENLLQCTNDPFFNDQWGLNHTGQNGWTPVGTDIKACQAWQTTTGSNNIIVAVFDEGIELNHPDMTNMHPYSFDTYTGTSPSVVRGSHGTAVAGIIGANSGNNIGVSGIAQSSPLMSISIQFGSATIYTDLANGMNWAWQNGAAVISNSWGGGSGSTLLDNAITNALTLGRNGLGCVVVFITGNLNSSSVSNPANSNPDILAVGAISPCAQRKSPSSCDGETWWGSNFGTTLDIMAPGVKIPTTDRQGSNGYDTSGGISGDYFQTFNGTSSATPHVAAVAALILSVNHNLTQKQVADVIESTAQKIGSYTYSTTAGRPNGTWNIQMGYGLVNADAAVLLAQSLCTSTQIDLFSKDSYNDFGVEPNVTTQYPWLSEDIWVRNTNDGFTTQITQNPEYSSTNDPAQLNYVYVRIRNKSCVASSGTETLDLRWAKAATSLAWPNFWNGSTYLDPPTNLALAGNLISTQTIPVIPAGGEVILPFTWNPPNPTDYSFNSEPWHFCLLSRIISTNDPMAVAEGVNLGANVLNNNNIAWKNLTVVDNVLGIVVGDCPQDIMQNIGVAVMVANPDNIIKTYDIKFSVPQEELSNPITTEGKITIALDEQLYEKWKQGGKKGTGITEIKSPPMSENGANNNTVNDNAPITVSNRKMFEIKETSSSFDNITLAANEVRTTSLMVTYPANPVSDKKTFNYDIVQKRSENGELIGGVRYAIQKPDCSKLIVDAGNNQTIKRGCSTALVAFSSSPLQLQLGKDCSSYQWYDDSGKLISQESAVKITPNKTTTYTLKFTSTSGCVSEDQVTITVLNQLCKKEKEIIKIAPNPADDFITIDYKALNTTNAYIRLLKTDNSIDRTYPLDLQVNQKTINVADYNFGSYIVILVCDGVNEDSEIVIIQ